jgi:LAO/AO transport system kinase
MWQQYLQQIQQGDVKALARSISLVENEVTGYELLLQSLPSNSKTVIGITGPPGAGKSTLTDLLIGAITQDGKKVGVLCIDPSSPFNLGALLGDRIRMSNWFNNPNVFIRSLATRGALGGLHPKIIEITDLIKAAPFDYIIIETVGIGQSEIDIVGLADITVVVAVPEAGDEIQTMKAGLMEIADIFVVNKADRPDADLFVSNLSTMLAPAFHSKNTIIPIIKTVASAKEGIDELFAAILNQIEHPKLNEKRSWLLAEKAYYLIGKKRMKGIDKNELKDKITKEGKDFNLYEFINAYCE